MRLVRIIFNMNCKTCDKKIKDKWKWAHPDRVRKYCSLECYRKTWNSPMKGKDSRIIFKCKWCKKDFKDYLSNKKNYKYHFCSVKCRDSWVGRYCVTPQRILLRKKKEYIEWRNDILERDGYKCVWCGATNSLQVDHIKSFAKHPKLRLEKNNGRTLCEPCHRKTDTWGVRQIYA